MGRMYILCANFFISCYHGAMVMHFSMEKEIVSTGTNGGFLVYVSDLLFLILRMVNKGLIKAYV